MRLNSGVESWKVFGDYLRMRLPSWDEIIKCDVSAVKRILDSIEIKAVRLQNTIIKLVNDAIGSGIDEDISNAFKVWWMSNRVVFQKKREDVREWIKERLGQFRISLMAS